MSVDNVISTLWSAELTKAFEKKQANLTVAVQEEDNPGFASVVKNIIQPQDGYSGRPRGALVQFPEESTSTVTITHVQYNVPRLIDNWDAARSNFRYRAPITEQVAAAMNRFIDTRVANAWNGSSNGVTIPDTNQMKLADLQVHYKAHMVNLTFEKGGMFAAFSPGAMDDLRQDTAVSNNFNFSNQIVATGSFQVVSGFNLIEEPSALPIVSGPGRRCFTVNKMATVLRYNIRPKIEVAYRVERQSWILVGTVGCEAAIILPPGVRYTDIAD